MNHKPFQQHQAKTPIKMPNDNWYRREIIFDQPKKMVYIQVMWDGLGYLSKKEFDQIKAGLWAQYVPASLAPVITDMVHSGYEIMAVAVVGGLTGEEHHVRQIVELNNRQQFFEHPTMRPITSNSIF